MTERTGRRRWMPLVLGLSLALNLAVVAAVAGASWRHKGSERGGPHGSKGGGVYMQALPREARSAVREQMRADKTPRVDASDMVAVLRNEPFDPAEAATVLEARRDAGMARQAVITAAWLKQITAMSAQDRSAYADRLEELSQRRKARWRRKGDAEGG